MGDVNVCVMGAVGQQFLLDCGKCLGCGNVFTNAPAALVTAVNGGCAAGSRRRLVGLPWCCSSKGLTGLPPAFAVL